SAVGLPILFYRSIPGHGEFNAKIMERAGAAKIVADESELVALLTAARAGDATLAPPPVRMAAPATSLVTRVLDRPMSARPILQTAPRAPRRAPRWAMAAAMIALLLWTIASPWAGGVA